MMDDQLVSRRGFLQAGAAATAAAAVAPIGAVAEEKKGAGGPLPRRKLGRTGVDVTILNQGAAFAIGDRHLNILHEEGIRYIDTADCYEMGASERACGEWLNKTGRRKEYFLVTKDHPRTPDQWVASIDRRLSNSKQDYIDLFFVHGLGDGGGNGYPVPESVDWPKDPEWAKAADRIRKTNKVKFVGFSTHCEPVERRIELLNNAAKGGWVDAIMVGMNSTLLRDNAAFNKAIDACHKAGIGLISMKEMRGGLPVIKNLMPDLEEKGHTPATAVLSAVWTDERITTICSHMDNIPRLKENAAAARNFKPLSDADLTAVHRMLDGYAKAFCIGCDGSCRKAAGTETAFSSIARYLCYYEESGQRRQARELFAALPAEARDWAGADLAAASRACVAKLDFEAILGRATDKLA